MKKIIITFIHIFLSLCLLVGCKSNKDKLVNDDNSTPSQTENTNESTSDSDELSSLPDFPFNGGPIELPTDEWE